MDRRRLLVVGGIVGLAAVVAVVAIVLSTRGGSGSGPSTTVDGSVSVTKLTPLQALQGIPQHGTTIGDPNAPATIEVFEDPQCPYCRQWSLQTFPTVAVDYLRTGKLKLVYRGVEIIGPNSIPGLRAIYAAAQQNKAWNLIEALYERQGAENSGWITPAVLKSAAARVGIDVAKLTAAESSPAVTSQISQAAKDFDSSGAEGTPTFFLLQPPAVPQELAMPQLDPQTFLGVLDAALRQQ
jgi:protein-disulfide isomerase